jgi:hypothetical protein
MEAFPVSSHSLFPSQTSQAVGYFDLPILLLEKGNKSMNGKDGKSLSGRQMALLHEA